MLTIPPAPTAATRRRVTATLTSFVGDADLYISFAPGIPSRQRADYYSVGADGPDAIVMCVGRALVSPSEPPSHSPPTRTLA